MRWLVVVVLAGCVHTSLEPCGDLLCGADQQCRAGECVSAAQIAACDGISDGEPCPVAGAVGVCEGGICHLAQCGNGVLEAGEACDDGGNVSGDGCSADCLSGEVCGNGVVDAIDGEQCDSGVPGLSGDGCTSTCKVEFDSWHDLTPRTLGARAYARMVYDTARDEYVLFGGFDGSQPLDETWVYKAGAWEQRTPPSSPDPRYSHAMVYDEMHHEVVLYGGTNGSSVFNDTWLWDGTEWTKLATPSAPATRRDPAMAYTDAGVTYLFGGTNGLTQPRADTWKFDGAHWMQLASSAPAPGDVTQMQHDAMAYDPEHARLVMTSECIDVTPATGETCEYAWLGTHWDGGTHVSALHIGSTLTWDPRRHRIVAAGGFLADGVTPAAQTWERDGATNAWSQATGTQPFVRAYAAAAAGPMALILYGGIDANAPLGDTWQRVDATWSMLATNRSPRKRVGAAGAYDVAARAALLFGGADTSTFADTWSWAPPTWTLGKSGPDARAYAGMAYDDATGDSVLFGGTDYTGVFNGEPIGGCGSGAGSGSSIGSGSGSGSGNPCPNELGDTWAYKAGAWTHLAVSGAPPARVLPALSYDPDGERVLLFGGQAGKTPLHDTWSFDRGALAWTPVDSAVSPGPLYYPRLAYDRARGRAVLYGVTSLDGTATYELWELTANTWERIQPTGAQPRPRTGAVLVYNPLRRRTLLFGGKLPSGQLLNDTWEWDGAAWTERFPVEVPPLRTGAVGMFDPLRGEVLIFDGLGSLGRRLDDIWMYGFAAPNVPTESCAPGEDRDGDALAGCADPDCWATCTGCPPGQSCP